MSENDLSRNVENLIMTITEDRKKRASTPAFLGLPVKDWGSWALKFAVVAVVSVFAWYQWVNTEIEARPTFQQVDESISKSRNEHSSMPMHAGAERVQVHQQEQIRKLTEIQVGQNEILKAQAESLREIKTDIREMRNRARRGN